jgi:GAF domain-containing protein
MLGVLEIALNISEELSVSDVAMLELFAAQAAIAIKNAQLFSEEKFRRQEAETLREVGLLINRMMDRPQLLDMILTALQKVVPYNSASIQLVSGTELVIEAFRGTDHPERVIGTAYNIKENLISHPVLYEGKNVILNKDHTDQLWLEGPESENIQSWLAVPLEVKGSRIGLLSLDSYQANQYTEQDAHLALDFANQAAIALENNRLFEELQRQTREMEAVYESALTLTQELHPDVLFEYLYEKVETLFTPDAFILATYEPTAETIQVSYATEEGVRQTQVEGLQIPLHEKNSLLSWIIRKKTPLLIGNVETDSLPVQPQQKGKNIRSWLGVPLLVSDRLIGGLVIQSYEAQAYTHDHRRLLQLLGNQVAIALENSRLFEDAQRRLFQLSSLREIDQAISGSIDLEMTMDVLVGQLIQTLDVDAACVLAFNPIGQTLEYISGRGFRTESLKNTSLKLGEGLAGKAALERSMVHIPDLISQPTSLQKSSQFDKEEFITYFAHPLISKGEIVGVLEVFHRKRLDPNPEWNNFLVALARMAAIAIDRLNLFNDLARSNIELKQAYVATIEGWARAIELRDGDTGEHNRRVVELVLELASKMGITGEELTYIHWGALLHDIGKIAIPDGILLNPGKLSAEEWLVMKKHPVFAYEMLSAITYLIPALDIPYCHHERWNGSGYPRGLTEEDIPLAARIFAVVDVWDALQSDRPYRDAWSEKDAIAYLKEQSGIQFDSQIVEVFFEMIGKS